MTAGMQGHPPTGTALQNSATTDVIEIKPYDANTTRVRPQAIRLHLDSNVTLFMVQAIFWHVVARTIVPASPQDQSMPLLRPTPARAQYLVHLDVMLGIAIGIGLFFAFEVVQRFLTSQSVFHWTTAILGVIGAAGLAGTTLLLIRDAYSSS